MNNTLAVNALDAAAGLASPRALEIMNLLGQCNERGYRSVLAPLWDCEPGSWSGPQWLVEKTITVINLVVHAADFQRRNGRSITDDQLADLVSFFIQRLRFMDLKVRFSDLNEIQLDAVQQDITMGR
jgi:hypothetical protein